MQSSTSMPPVTLWQIDPNDMLPKKDDGHSEADGSTIPPNEAVLSVDQNILYLNHRITVTESSPDSKFVNIEKVVLVVNKLLVFAQVHVIYLANPMVSTSFGFPDPFSERKTMELKIDNDQIQPLMEAYRAGALEIIDFVAGSSGLAAKHIPGVILVKNAEDFEEVYTKTVMNDSEFKKLVEKGHTTKYNSKKYNDDITGVRESNGEVIVKPVIENQTNNSTSIVTLSLTAILTAVVVSGMFLSTKKILGI